MYSGYNFNWANIAIEWRSLLQSNLQLVLKSVDSEDGVEYNYLEEAMDLEVDEGRLLDQTLDTSDLRR